MPPAAAAPAVDGSPSTDIVVTGYGASLRSALNTKRAVQPADRVGGAGRIGKMPDQNVAELLQRLPGVQIDRRTARALRC